MRTRSPTLSCVSASIRSGVHSPCCELSITSNRAPLSFCLEGRSRHRVTPSSSLLAGRVEVEPSLFEEDESNSMLLARRYVGRLLRRTVVGDELFRVRALELETTSRVSADFAGRARRN